MNPTTAATAGTADPVRDERLRAEGRAQANNAITWDTSCLGCADRLDSLYAERVAGGVDTLGDVVDLLTAQGFGDAVAAVRAYAARNSLQLRESATDGASAWDSERVRHFDVVLGPLGPFG